MREICEIYKINNEQQNIKYVYQDENQFLRLLDTFMVPSMTLLFSHTILDIMNTRKSGRHPPITPNSFNIHQNSQKTY